MRPIPFNDPVIFAVREDWIHTLDNINQANVNLIEASPNLLRAARKALKLIQDTWIEEHGQRQVGEAWGALADAIDKATGVKTDEVLKFYDPETILSREGVVRVLAAENEMCEPSRIGYYNSVPELAERVSGTSNWDQGEVFVFAQSTTRYLILKQIAPSSCEMLTISNHGYHDVLTAYRFNKDTLVNLLESFMTRHQESPELTS